MNAILLVQRKFTYHGNLIGKSRITCLYNSKSLIKLRYPVPRHAANLVSITHHAVNFGAITCHANTLCHRPQKKQNDTLYVVVIATLLAPVSFSEKTNIPICNLNFKVCQRVLLGTHLVPIVLTLPIRLVGVDDPCLRYNLGIYLS